MLITLIYIMHMHKDEFQAYSFQEQNKSVLYKQ